MPDSFCAHVLYLLFIYVFWEAKFTDSFINLFASRIFAGHRYYTGLLDLSMAPFGALLRWWSDPKEAVIVLGGGFAKGGFPFRSAKSAR